jgi:hypothetical protein
MKEKLLRWWLPVLVGVAIAWQFRAPLLGRVWIFEDIGAYFHPLWSAAARQMRLGSFPSWELGGWSGQPLLGDPQIGVLYPPNWLWLLLRPLRAFAWLQLFHAGLGAAGMWALARARGRSRAAAALAALSLGLGAFVVLETRHAMFVATTAWLPWLLWAVDRWAHEQRAQHLVAIAGALGLALLAGGWSMLYFGAAVIAIFSLARVAEAERAVRLRVLAGLAFAACVGVALAAVQLGPALVHTRLSPRALGVDYTFASSYAWPSWRYLLTLLFPTLHGDDARGTYTGAPDQWELCGYAIGAVATLLALFSLVERKGRAERIALFVAVAVACDLARGAGGLLHPLFFRWLPLYGSLRCPARALYVWTLAGPLLAADGLDALGARLPERRRGLVAGAVVVALAAELLVTWRSEFPSVTLAEAQGQPDAVGFLRSQRRRHRMATDVHLPTRFQNAGLAWGYESAVGYSSLPIWRYLHLLYIANHRHPYPHDKLADDLTGQGLWRFESPLVDLLGVGFVVTPHDRSIDAPGFQRVFEGTDGIDVWRNHESYPRVFVAHRARVIADERAQAEAIADDAFRPAQVVIVGHPVDGVPEPRPDEILPRPTEHSALLRESPEDLIVEVELKQPGVLVIAEPWYPTWLATVDGRPAELLRVDYALKGVALPAGRHQVALRCSDRALAWGAAISSAALLLLCALALYERRRRAKVAAA